MAHKLPPEVLQQVTKNVVKDIFIGLALGVAAAGVWKTYHWKQQRKTKEFYEMLERGEISVVHDE